MSKALSWGSFIPAFMTMGKENWTQNHAKTTNTYTAIFFPEFWPLFTPFGWLLWVFYLEQKDTYGSDYVCSGNPSGGRREGDGAEAPWD